MRKPLILLLSSAALLAHCGNISFMGTTLQQERPEAPYFLEYTNTGKADLIIGSNSGTLKMTPLVNYNKMLIANRNCTTCGGKHAYDPSLGVTWAVKGDQQVNSINFAFHSSIPIVLNGTLMKDSICAKQAE